MDAGYGLVVPIVNGAVVIETELAPGSAFTLTPDGAGGTMVHRAGFQGPSGVSITEAAGSTVNVAVGNPTLGPVLQLLVAPLNTAAIAGTTTTFTAAPGDTMPAIAAGQTLEIIAAASGAYPMPTGVNAPPSAFISPRSAAVTVAGGDADGQIVLAGTSGLAFTAGFGQGSVLAGGGANAVTVPTGAGAQFIQLGDGANTIRAFNRADTIVTGIGGNYLRLGLLGSNVTSAGADTIIGDAGQGNRLK